MTFAIKGIHKVLSCPPPPPTVVIFSYKCFYTTILNIVCQRSRISLDPLLRTLLLGLVVLYNNLSSSNLGCHLALVYLKTL